MSQDRRRQLTQAVLDSLSNKQDLNLDKALLHWWQNFSTNGGLRLTAAGYDAFCIVAHGYCFDLPLGFLTLPRHLLTLDKKITCPYFLRLGKRPQITVFDSKTAMMLALYQDPEKWVAFLQQT